MKLSLVSLVIVCCSTAFAGNLARRAALVTKKLVQVENSLDSFERSSVKNSLEELEYKLGIIPDRNDAKLVCISDGEFGGFERFDVTDLRTGIKYGKKTTKRVCDAIIDNIKNGILCASNGEFGGFEKFVPTSIESQRSFGSYTSMNTCQELVRGSAESFICASNGEFGGFEKFRLLNIQSMTSIGGETSLSNCLMLCARSGE